MAGDETGEGGGHCQRRREEDLMSRSSGFYPVDQCFYGPRTVGVRIPWGKKKFKICFY